MILVTVGTHPQGFERLVRAADELAASLDERVVIQYGASGYIPQRAEGFRFTAGQEMERLTAEARLVVTHAAAGAIILALQQGKPLVLVPRLKRYREHLDDHQTQLARALHDQRRAIAVFDPSAAALAQAVRQIGEIASAPADASGLVDALRVRLAAWEGLSRR